MKIIRSGSLPSVQGPEARFTGCVRIDAPFRATEPAKVGGATVTFEPGARTAAYASSWTNADRDAGARLVTGVGKEAEPLNQGDIARIPPGVKHWHGASAQTAMTHIAIAEAVDGSPVAWLEKVTDEQYPNE